MQRVDFDKFAQAKIAEFDPITRPSHYKTPAGELLITAINTIHRRKALQVSRVIVANSRIDNKNALITSGYATFTPNNVIMPALQWCDARWLGIDDLHGDIAQGWHNARLAAENLRPYVAVAKRVRFTGDHELSDPQPVDFFRGFIGLQEQDSSACLYGFGRCVVELVERELTGDC